MRSLWPILLLFSMSILNQAQAIICTGIPPDLSEPNYGVVEWLGSSYGSDRERIKVNSCLNGQKVFDTTSSSAELYVGLLTDYQEVYREINRSSGGKIKIGWFSFGKSRSFTQRIIDKAYTQTFVLAFDIKTGNGRFEIDSNDPLNNLADRVKHDACEFKKYCGDSFVFQTEEGVKFLLGIQISFSSHDQFQQYNTNFSMGIEGALKGMFGICTACGKVDVPFNISFKGDFSKAVEDITSSLRQQGRIEFFALQQGGDVAQLGKVLGSNNALGSCSLDNRDACLQMGDNALAYIASDEFIAGAKNMPGVLNYVKRPFWEVDPDVPDLPQEVTPEIENARLLLATEFDQRLADQDRIQTTLGLQLDSARQQQLVQLQADLAIETQVLYQTGLLCFSDLEHCVEEAEKVLVGLKAYDSAILSSNMNDGLVAHYPFDGDIKDYSGNKNDGFINKQDVYTKGKSDFALKLDGSTYINLNDRLDVLGGSLTISTWLRTDKLQQSSKLINKGQTSAGTPAESGYSIRILSPRYTTSQKYELAFSLWDDQAIMTKASIPVETLPENKFFFITGVLNRKNSSLELYVNGSLVSTALGKLGFSDTNIPLAIGALHRGSFGTTSEFLNGELDELRIYNRALIALEIQHLYTTTSSELNQPPFAAFTTALNSSIVNLDASASSDTDGNIVSYAWQVNGIPTANGKIASLNLSQTGAYQITLTVTDDKGATSQAVKTLNVEALEPTAARLTNISVRCPIGAGGAANHHNQVVAGFVVSGTAPKKVLIRAQDSGLNDGVQQACLTLYALSNGTPQQKDNNCSWKQHASAAHISGLSSNLIPPNDTDAAMIVSLEPGVYTAEAYGNDFVGTVSLEDLDESSVDSRLMNLSGRCLVETSPRNAVVGFVMSGDSSTSMNLLVRGLTSGLTQQPSIFDPNMNLYRLNVSNGTAMLFDSVENWRTHRTASCVSSLATNLVPSSDRDVAFCVRLNPGVYTGEVSANIADVATISVDVLP